MIPWQASFFHPAVHTSVTGIRIGPVIFITCMCNFGLLQVVVVGTTNPALIGGSIHL